MHRLCTVSTVLRPGTGLNPLFYRFFLRAEPFSSFAVWLLQYSMNKTAKWAVSGFLEVLCSTKHIHNITHTTVLYSATVDRLYIAVQYIYFVAGDINLFPPPPPPRKL